MDSGFSSSVLAPRPSPLPGLRSVLQSVSWDGLFRPHCRAGLVRSVGPFGNEPEWFTGDVIETLGREDFRAGVADESRRRELAQDRSVEHEL